MEVNGNFEERMKRIYGFRIYGYIQYRWTGIASVYAGKVYIKPIGRSDWDEIVNILNIQYIYLM